MGAWQGFWVTRVGVSSFIVTLAGMLYFRGISMIATNGATVAPLPRSLTGFATGFLPPRLVDRRRARRARRLRRAPRRRDPPRRRRSGVIGGLAAGRCCARSSPPAVAAAVAIWIVSWQGIPYLVLLVALCTLAAEFVMRRTRFGAQLYAIGGNPEAARLSGINIGARDLLELRHRRPRLRHHRRRADRAGQRRDRRQRRAVPRARRHRRRDHRRHLARRRPRPDPRRAARRAADGQPQQRHEPDERADLLPGHRARHRAAARRRHRPAQPAQVALIGSARPIKAAGCEVGGLARVLRRRPEAAALPDQVGRLLGDHHDRRGGVAGGDRRHDRGVDDAEPVEAVDAQRSSTTARSSRPMRQVPTGWKIVVAMSPMAARDRRRLRRPGRAAFPRARSARAPWRRASRRACRTALSATSRSRSALR